MGDTNDLRQAQQRLERLLLLRRLHEAFRAHLMCRSVTTGGKPRRDQDAGEGRAAASGWSARPNRVFTIKRPRTQGVCLLFNAQTATTEVSNTDKSKIVAAMPCGYRALLETLEYGSRRVLSGA